VVAGGADVTRTMRARLGARTRLTLRETVVLGRAGERGGRVVLRSAVTDDAGPLLVEDVTAVGADPVPGVLGGHRVVDTLAELHGSPAPEVDDDLDDPATPARDVGGAVTLRLERGGTLTRWLGSAAHLSPVGRSAPAPVSTTRQEIA
jgi:urease accessory protein